MKVLYIDPWYTKNTNLSYYSSGLTNSISNYCDLSVVCSYDVDTNANAKCKFFNIFFPKSNRMKKTKFRSVIRGLEYLKACSNILRLIKKNKYDVVHIEWLVLYRHDYKMLKKIKKYCKLLVLKVHNILPHEYGDKYIDIFRKIYGVPDLLLLHGLNLIAQFDALFHEYSYKTRIQLHGFYMNHDITYDTNEIEKDVLSKTKRFGRIYLFFGRIGFDKGVDRLISVWKKCSLPSKPLLIIAGRIGKDLSANDLRQSVNGVDNILFLPGFINDNLLNFLIDSSTLVFTTYRNGSMSGVIFTAAEFSKPVLATNFGSVAEYIIDKKTGFICENNDESIKNEIETIDSIYGNEELCTIGRNHNKRMKEYFDWGKIGKDLVEITYQEGLNNHR